MTVRLPAKPAQTKSSFIPHKCRLARQIADETTPPTHPISENSSVNDWSRGLVLQQNQLWFPTRAVLPDDGRRDNTLPQPPFPKTHRQMAVLAISSYFHFFVFSLIFLEGEGVPAPRPPASYAYVHKSHCRQSAQCNPVRCAVQLETKP